MPEIKQLQHEMFNRDEIERNYPGFINCRQQLGSIDTLFESIKQNGLQTSPTIYRILEGEAADDVKIILLAGNRRMACIDRLVDEVEGADEAFAQIDCAVFEGTIDEAMAFNLADNVRTQDLNPADAMVAVAGLMARFGTQIAVAAALGMSQPWVSGYDNMAKFLCPHGKELLRSGAITKLQAERLSTFRTKKPVGPDTIKQEAEIDKLLHNLKGDKADKKERKIQSKETVQDFRRHLLSDAVEMDEQHRESLLTFISWFNMEIDNDQVMVRQPRVAPTLAAEAPEEAPAVAETPKKKRLRDAA